MAAVARTPTPSDGRLPCPQCGGLVHPIAGRCKHCKADLADARAARPAAAAALPALAGTGSPRRDVTPVPSPIRALAQAAADPQPILPPRQTGHMQAPNQPSGSLLRNWPVLVIVLAGIAIAAAVIIMVWPASTTAKADSRLAPPPAPERMDTNPLPPHSSLTPPTAPQAPGGADPWNNKPPAAPDPDDLDPADPLAGPFATPGSGGGGVFGGIIGGPAVMFSVFEHACSRMTSCGNSQLAPFCMMLNQAGGSMPAPTCAAAQRCLARIDQLDCNAGLSSQADVMAAMTTIQDCTDAMTRC